MSRPNLSQKFRRSFKCLESSSIPARDRATVKTTQTIIARIPAGCFPQFPTPSSSRRQRPRPTTLWLVGYGKMIDQASATPPSLPRLSRELAGAGSRLSSGHAPLCSWRSACSGLIAEPVRAAIGTFGGTLKDIPAERLPSTPLFNGRVCGQMRSARWLWVIRCTVTFRRDDGRVRKYRIVGEDEAEPKADSISFVSPVAGLLMGKAVGVEVGASKSVRSFQSRSAPAPDAAEEWPLRARSGRSGRTAYAG